MGLGSAANKKDAETNAAKDFCGFLIGAGIIPADSFPDDLFVSSICHLSGIPLSSSFTSILCLTACNILLNRVKVQQHHQLTHSFSHSNSFQHQQLLHLISSQ